MSSSGLFAGGGEILRQAFSCCPSVAGVDEVNERPRRAYATPRRSPPPAARSAGPTRRRRPLVADTLRGITRQHARRQSEGAPR